MFLALLMSSTLIGVSSSSWLMVWITLEINSLSMCYLISAQNKKENHSEGSTLLYLLIQVMSSIILINVMLPPYKIPQKTMICTLMLMVKMGAWPFQAWYTKLFSLMKMKMSSMLTIMTWQKILPLAMMSFLMNTPMLLMMCLINMVTPLAGLKSKISMKNLMVLSSLNNNGWLLVLCVCSTPILLSFLAIYSSALTITLSLVKTMKTKMNTNSIPTLWKNFVMLSNISGMPPMLMFSAKVMALATVMKALTNSESFMMVMMAMAFMFIYAYSYSLSNSLLSSPAKSMMVYNKQNSMEKYFLATALIAACSTMALIVSLG